MIETRVASSSVFALHVTVFKAGLLSRESTTSTQRGPGPPTTPFSNEAHDQERTDAPKTTPQQVGKS